MADLTWSEFTALIAGVPVIHMATSSREGEPHVAVVSAGVDGFSLVIAAKRDSAKVRNVTGNPRVSLVWQGNSAETYLWGSVAIIDDPREKSRLWNGGFFPYDMSMFFGSATDPGWSILRITPTRVVAMVQGQSGLVRRVWTP